MNYVAVRKRPLNFEEFAFSILLAPLYALQYVMYK